MRLLFLGWWKFLLFTAYNKSDHTFQRLTNPLPIEGLSSDDPEDKIALSAIKVVKKLETKYQQALRDNYVTMDDTTFKTLRRKLPINQQKFNWDHIDHLRIGNEIKKN